MSPHAVAGRRASFFEGAGSLLELHLGEDREERFGRVLDFESNPFGLNRVDRAMPASRTHCDGHERNALALRRSKGELGFSAGGCNSVGLYEDAGGGEIEYETGVRMAVDAQLAGDSAT